MKNNAIDQLRNLEKDLKNKIDEINYQDKNLKDAIYQLTDIHNLIKEEINSLQVDGGLNFLKEIDFIRFFGAKKYEANITKELCDVQNIISCIKSGFKNLKCNKEDWGKTAKIGLKFIKEDTPAKLYCGTHSEFIDSTNEGYIDLEGECKDEIKNLKLLEKLLIVLQEQMKYFKKIDDDNNKILKESVNEKYSSLQTVLSEMTSKANDIKFNYLDKKKELSYEKLDFVNSGFQICKTYIVDLLKLIYEADLNFQIGAKLKAILNWSRDHNESIEEEKQINEDLALNKIYDNIVSLCMIPTQTLNKVTQLEEKIKKMAKFAITCQKVRLSERTHYHSSLSSIFALVYIHEFCVFVMLF